MHHIRMIHTDLKPENVLFVSGESRTVRVDRGERFEPVDPSVMGTHTYIFVFGVRNVLLLRVQNERVWFCLVWSFVLLA